MGLRIGDKVTYTAEASGTVKKGIISSLHSGNAFIFVVYDCSEDWDNFNDYTGQLTLVSNLTKGWKDE